MRLGEFLVRDGLITKQQLESVLAAQKEMALAQRKPIGQMLLDRGYINEEQLYRALAKQYELPFVDLRHLPVNPRAVAEFEPEFLRKHRVLPFDIEVDTLLVATADPTALDVHDLLCFRTNRRVAEVLVTPSQLAEALDRHTTSPEKEEDVESILEEMDRFSEPGVATPTSPEEENEISETDNAVVRLVNRIIADAHIRGASDIHIEPRGSRVSTRVRFRVDGECTSYSEIPAGYWRAVVSRIKIMSHLDISERRKPQDGKIKLKLRNRPLELRVATVPTVNGEDVVLRLLASHRALPLVELGMLPHNLDRFDAAVRQPNGLILCVGPTGSGKTTTLHAALGTINTVERKIWTAEDPVEITQQGLRQVQVNPKAGITFASTLRSFLRADPDVIMIGEMRDQETASIAVESSMTGHLVFSTLHTNSAPETVNRLLDMGLDPFNFSDALLAILAQRLARRLCEHCRRQQPATPAELEQVAAGIGDVEALQRLAGIDLSRLKLWHAVGCERCNGTGYRGRVALHELLVADDEIRAMIQHRKGAAEVREAAIRGGMTTLLQDGIIKCIQGATDLKRVAMVCNR
jgi:type II secretory ATPase GspE/PulE/Tfp pilus assembly ATPase PilB-like protein